MADSILRWLEENGLEKYSDVFIENEITVHELHDLTEDDLKELGLPMGPRKRFQRALNQKESATATVVAKEPDLDEAGQSNATERRQLTIMFCDLVGSTTLSEQIDPEDLREVMRRYQDAVAGAATRYGGHIAKYLGDGVLTYFGWPQAYEDQAERAVRAGLDAIAEVEKLSVSGQEPLKARVGIATGIVVVGDLVGKSGREAKAVTGQTPNLAARLQGLAEPGEVVVSGNTRRVIGSMFEWEALGAQELKGFSEPVQAWRVASSRTVENRFEARQGVTPESLVGREHELGLLLERWELAKQGESQIVELSGEAGIGKSRIVRALLDAIADDEHFRLSYNCSPHHTNSAYYPIVRRLEQAAGFLSADDANKKLDKLENLLRLSGQDTSDDAPWFAILLSLPVEARFGKLDLTPQRRREGITKALLNQVLALAQFKPVLFVVEDMHWVDPTTRDFLDLLAHHVADIPVLILATDRQQNSLSGAANSHVTSISLNRLSRAQSKQIIQISGGAGFSEDVIDQIVARADGVPLYVEELARSVAEAEGEAGSTEIPETLHDSLMARLDRLGTAKEVAQIGSVIGRDFGHQLLAVVASKPEKELTAALDAMVDAELVSRRGVPPDIVYTFKHALVQGVAYQSLLKRNRQVLHQRVAETLDEQFASLTHNQPELVAYHFNEAGLAEKSVPHWLKAGQQAIERSANLEAIAHLNTGLDILGTLPHSPDRDAQELEFRLALGPALMSIKGLAAAEAEEMYLRARELCESSGGAAQSYQAAWGLWLVYQQRGQIDLAQSATQEVLSLAEKQKENVDYLLQAHHAAWTTQLFVGNNLESQSHLIEGDALYDLEKHRNHAFTYGGHDPGVCAKTTASEALFLLGYPEQAAAKAEDGVALANKIAHPFSLAMAHYFMAQVYQYRLEIDTVGHQAQVAIDMCEKNGFESFHAQATVLLGWATAASGESNLGIETIQRGLKAWQATGTGMRRPYFLALLGDALFRANLLTEGIEVVSEAEALIKKTGETRWQAETLRLKGALLEQNNSAADDVEVAYQHALDIAQQQDAKSLQLRAAISLCRFWQSAERQQEAHELLVPLFSWFSEGFETPDLIAAKTLLRELQ
ncbi:adenylate/guanylate cyclase domain-containing protein [Sulfitobacter mediterraneus]|uniref:SAM (Sterile alpha motif) domain-containing protein n=1 Tax=Sulfitobacter mediterraneus TaxID=83219 RepID=A0A2T6CB64_9RHOB|nr:adenylate/guanylate cyclase domain-containing protein [Sulfitobacter mediterraneus]KIN76933.1 Adenylate/guanylate cyclase family protein [Sulfitobacter mediterraneus KCTC 32188]PTX72745.1 SAM (Sterile alpha motif) domain-containing protein [Sulfitobacter mediterraneus]